MPEHFRTLAELLAGPAVHCETVTDVIEGPPQPTDEYDATLRAVRLFHASIAEAIDSAVEILLQDIAAGVLARELQLAPADISAVVASALERFADEVPLCVRVHPGDAPADIPDVPVIADETLRPGDALIELRCGGIDASLGARLEMLLRAVS